MSNLSLKAKLTAAFGLLLAIMVSLGLYSFYALQSVNGKTTEITENWTPGLTIAAKMADATADCRAAVQSHIITSDATEMSKLEAEVADADQRMQQLTAEYRRLIDNTVYNTEAEKQNDIAMVEQIKAQWSPILKATQNIFPISHDPNRQAEAIAIARQDVIPQIVKLQSEVLQPVMDFSEQGTKTLAVEAADVYDTSKWVLTVVILVAILLSVAVMLLLMRSILQAVGELMRISTKVASGDLRDKAVVKSGDELGKLTLSYNAMIDNIRKLIAQIQKTAEQVAASSQELTASADQSAQVTQDIAKSITNVSGNSMGQVDAVKLANGEMESVASGIEETTTTIGLAAKSTGEVVETAKQGTGTIDQAVQQMSNIEVTVGNLAQVVAKLGDRSKEIGQIVDTISGIAGQTNLLALNAAIEAARAGEMGKGFAVVAEEVRKLAEQSQEAAKEIETLISEIQVDTEKAVEAMEQGTQEVKAGADVVNEAGSAFGKICEMVDQLNSQARAMSTTMETLSQGTQRVATSVQQIDDSSKNIASEAQSVSAATEEQSASMEEVAASSRGLAQLAQELTQMSNRFKI